ncbi:MAG: hypothetical protein QM622_10380 [Microbacterium sp.]
MTVVPNAFLTLSREGYRGPRLNLRDLGETLGAAAFWRFSARNAPSPGATSPGAIAEYVVDGILARA